MAKLLYGAWVEFSGDEGRAYGRIKLVGDRNSFVVFDCGGRWERFMQFEAECVPNGNLRQLTAKEVEAIEVKI